MVDGHFSEKLFYFGITGRAPATEIRVVKLDDFGELLLSLVRQPVPHVDQQVRREGVSQPSRKSRSYNVDGISNAFGFAMHDLVSS